MIAIRPYEPQDFSAIQAAHDPARRQELANAGLEAAFLPLPVAAEQEGLFDYTVEVAVLNGQVVGFVAFTGEELAWLYVRPDCQRRGYGRRLIDFVKDRYRGRFHTLQVGTGDSPLTVPFYLSCGFVRSHTLPGFFLEHYDHPIYECGKRLADMVYFQQKM